MERTDIVQSISSVDYYQEMNSEVFKTWFVDLLRGLKEGCVIVMDNASYHCTHLEKIPTTKTRKAETVQWMEGKRIHHDPNLTVSS